MAVVRVSVGVLPSQGQQGQLDHWIPKEWRERVATAVKMEDPVTPVVPDPLSCDGFFSAAFLPRALLTCSEWIISDTGIGVGKMEIQLVRLICFQYLKGHPQCPVSGRQKIGQVQVTSTPRFSQYVEWGLGPLAGYKCKRSHDVMWAA